MTDDEDPAVPVGEGLVSVPREHLRQMVADTFDMERQTAEYYATLISGIPALRAIVSGDDSSEHVIQIRELVEIAAPAGDLDPELLASLEGGGLAWKLVYIWGRSVEIDVRQGDDLAGALDQIEPALRAGLVKHGVKPLTPSDLEGLADLVVAAAAADAKVEKRGTRWLALIKLAARLGAMARAGAPLVPFPLSELALIEASNAGAVISERVRVALTDQGSSGAAGSLP